MNKNMILSVIACSVLFFAVTLTAAADLDGFPVSGEVQEQMFGGRGMQRGGGSGVQVLADEPGEIVKSSAVNTAAALQADLENAVSVIMSDAENEVKIDASGTYVISGSASDGNITVKKGTKGVVLVLKDLDLTSTTGAPLSINKETEVKVVISGTVTLTDAENPSDENSSNAESADAYDGAALKVKADSMVYLTGDGTLNLIGQAKNGIKGGDNASLILAGPALRIAAVNDGIYVNYDLTILSGSIAVSAGDDAIHADHILTIGSEDHSGPVINITQCGEALEATVVNIFGGDITMTASDDAVNAADKDELYKGQLTPSINMTGGSVTISGQGDGFDSNGNINLIGGSAAVNTQFRGGEAGVDYDGAYYISDDFQMTNSGGVSGPDNMGNMGGGFGQGGRGGWGRP
ncbi:MAG: carbohydrate-binding domain-containing protein [Anaerolineaceae bacterium]|nr:carbohydrate-binding domain-containing protein [Anaerolineaceae bacterium]